MMFNPARMLLVLACGLAGCAGPAVELAHVAPTTPLSQWRTDAGSGSLIDAQWWQGFGDPQLSTFVGDMPGRIARSSAFDQIIQPDIPASLPSELLRRRPDVAQAELSLIQIEANQLNKRIALFQAMVGGWTATVPPER